MGTLSTPFKQGTVSAISGTTLTVTGFTPDSGDVGRLVCFNSGTARHQHREIVAVSGQDLTLNHSLDTSPLLGFTDNDPTVGDALYLSYNATELVSQGHANLSSTNHLNFVGYFIIKTGVFFNIVNHHISWNGVNISVENGAGLILGKYSYVNNRDMYTYDSCQVTEVGSGVGHFIQKNNYNYGLFCMYGGSVNVIQNQIFWRLNGAGSSGSHARLVGVTTNGDFGGRIEGNKSAIVDCQAIGATTTSIGFLNPLSSVSRFEVNARNCRQVGYINLNFGTNARQIYGSLIDITERLIRLTGDARAGVYEIIAKKSDIDALPTFLNSDGDKGTHIIRYGNLIKPSFVNTDTSSFTNELKTTFVDNTQTVVDSQTISTGQFSEIFVRHTDLLTTAVQDYNLNDGTSFSPYVLRVFSYGFQILNQTITVEDTFDAALTILPDTVWSGRTKVVVDALAFINTNQDCYDSLLSYLYDNFADNGAVYATIEGELIDFGAYNVVLDQTASSNVDVSGNTITLRTSTYTGTIRTTGTVTTVNGATVASFFDSTQDSFFTFTGVDSWKVFSSSSDADSNSNELASGISGQSFGFNFSGGTTYYFRLVLSGETIQKSSTPTQTGETVVSLSTTALVSSVATSVGYIAGKVFCNTSALINGNGSFNSPTNTLDSAITQANLLGIHTIDVTSPTVPAAATVDCSGLEFEASIAGNLFNFNGQDFERSTLKNFITMGAIGSGTTIFKAEGCIFQGMSTTGLTGLLSECLIAANVSVSGTDTVFDRCIAASAGLDPVISLENNTANLRLSNFSGRCSLANVVTGNSLSIDGLSGEITIEPSCTGGLVRIYENVEITDNSNGSTIQVSDLPTLANLENSTVLAKTVDITSLNNLSAADVNAQVDQALSDYDGPTKAEFDSGLAALNNVSVADIEASSVLAKTSDVTGLNNLSAADVNAQVDQALSDYDGPTKAEFDSGLAALNNVSVADIRTELSVELGRIDTSVGSRLAGASYTTPPSVVEIEAALLNEGDGQQLINAIATAINSQDIDVIALVAAIRADLERTGGMLATVPTLPEIESSTALAKASQITALNDISAADLWSYGTREVTGGVISSMSGTINTLDELNSSLEVQHNSTQSSITSLNNISAADVWNHSTKLITGGVISSMSGTITTLDQLDTSQTQEHASTRTAISNLNDITPEQVWSHSGKQVDTIAGTIGTLDALDTAQSASHATTQNLISALNNLSAADVNAQVDQALSDYDGPTKAELDAAQTVITDAIAGLSDASATEVAQQVWDYLQSETTLSNSMKEAVQTILTRSGLIPAAV